jgi:hypothetical protein
MSLTDGMLERNAASVDIEAALAEGRDMHPREAVQHLTHVLLRAAGGKLSDDATALCFDWHGGLRRRERPIQAPTPEVASDWRLHPHRLALPAPSRLR